MMQKKFWLLLICVFFSTLNFATSSRANAQSDGCYWQLLSETPKSFTVSSAPDASSSVSGTTVTTNWLGLTTTHYWSHPGSKLVPGDTVGIEVSASWEISSGDALNSTGGLKTSFIFGSQSISAGRQTIHYNAEKAGSVSNSTAFTVPSGSEGGTFSIYGFADAAVAGGRVDYKYKYICITPTPTTTSTITRTPTRTITPTKCPADTDEKKWGQIVSLYINSIPKGKTSSGEINNIYDFFGYPGYAEFTCGGYQSKVLDFLNQLKFSENPCEKELLDKYDYGPIQAWFGYHQAVVVYPKGTDWQKTGIVLDPWPAQKPQTFLISAWALMFSSTNFTPATYIGEQVLGPTFVGIGASEVYRDGKAYPIVGGDYKDAANDDTNITFSEQEFRIIQKLPADKREAFKQMSKPEQKRWLQVVMQGGENIQKIIAHCPINLYVIDSNGRRSGISGDKIFNELPDVSFMVLKLVDGTNYTEISYPEVEGYTLVLEGVDNGQTHVFQGHYLLLGERNPGIQHYNFSASKGETYQIAGDQLGAPMQCTGPSLQPELMTEISDSFLKSMPGLALPGNEENITEEITDKDELTGGLPDWKPPYWAVILIILIGTILITFILVKIFARSSKKRQQNIGQSNSVGSRSSTLEIWVILIIALIISIALLSLGVYGLLRNLRSNHMETTEFIFDQTITALRATEAMIANQITDSYLKQAKTEISELSEQPKTPQPEIVETPAPSNTPLLPTPAHSSTMELTSTSSLPLSGKQYLDNYSIMDDFSSNAFGWPEVDDGRKIQKFEQGGYSFQLLTKDDFDIVYLPVSFNPSEILFDVRGAEGDQDGTFGIFCQFQDKNNYYYVEFDMLTKTYVIAQSLDGEYIPLTSQTDSGQYWHDADSFKEPTDVNKISVGCYLGSIYVVVNDVLVDDVIVSNPFPQKGRSALFVYTYNFAGDNGYKVIFDNLEAYEPMQ